MKRTQVYCCKCAGKVSAILRASGTRGYPKWVCPTCANYVGCHKVGQKPLGSIPTPELRQWRIRIHEVLDKLWRTKKQRSKIYSQMSEHLGFNYHTAYVSSVSEAQRVYQMVHNLTYYGTFTPDIEGRD